MSGLYPREKKTDPMYHIHGTLLPLVLTIFFVLSVEVTGASGPTRGQVKAALQTVGKFLKDDTGSSWLATASEDQDEALTTEELMGKIINSTISDGGVREAAGIISLALEQQKTGAKTNESLIEPESLKKFVETMADRDDVTCLYRTKSEVPTGRVKDWERSLKHHSLKKFSTYVALDTGIQEVLCLKKYSPGGVHPMATADPALDTPAIPPKGLLKPPPIIPVNGANTPSEMIVNNPTSNGDEETAGLPANEACGSAFNPCTPPICSNLSAPNFESVGVLPTLAILNASEEMAMEVKKRGITGGSRGAVGERTRGGHFSTASKGSEAVAGSILPDKLLKSRLITSGNGAVNVPDDMGVYNPLVNEDKATVGRSANEDCGSAFHPCTFSTSPNSSASNFGLIEAPAADEGGSTEMSMRSITRGTHQSMDERMKGENSSTGPTTIEAVAEEADPIDKITFNPVRETPTIIPEELLRSPLITSENRAKIVSDEMDVNNSLGNEDKATVAASAKEDCLGAFNPCASPISFNSFESEFASIEAPRADEEVPAEMKIGSRTRGSHGLSSIKRRTENPCRRKNDDFRSHVSNRFSKAATSSGESFASSGNQSPKSSNYALYICPFCRICRGIKAPERRHGLMNIPSHSELNNETLERLLNPQAQHSRFSRNGNGFVKNLHDNGILSHPGYSKRVNTYFIPGRSSEDEIGDSKPFDLVGHQNSVSGEQPVRPSSQFVAGQFGNGECPSIFLDPQIDLVRRLSEFHSRQIDTSGNRENDYSGGGGRHRVLNLKIFVNNPSREPGKLSIHTDVNSDIEVYNNMDRSGYSGMSQPILRMFKRGERAPGEAEDELVTEVDKQEVRKHSFDALMDLSTPRD